VRDNQPSTMPKLSIQPFPCLTSGQPSPPGEERLTLSPPKIEIGNSHDEASVSGDNMVRQVIEPKCD
jgi:hypothetical protein